MQDQTVLVGGLGYDQIPDTDTQRCESQVRRELRARVRAKADQHCTKEAS